MKNFTGQTAYISGASSGIGYAITRELLGKGARCVLLARDLSKLEEAKEKLVREQANSPERKKSESAESPEQRIFISSLDISDADQVIRKIPEIRREAGLPDILVNCAGRALCLPFEDSPYPDVKKLHETNFLGTWNLTRQCLPLMKENRHKKQAGLIVNVSSFSGFMGTFGYTAYSASKFALVGFSEALRQELKPRNIRVSVLCPQDTDTPQLAEENKTKPPEARAISGNSRIMKPEEIADAFMKGIRKNRFMIIPGTYGKLIYRVNRLFPGFVRALLDSDVAKAQKTKKEES